MSKRDLFIRFHMAKETHYDGKRDLMTCITVKKRPIPIYLFLYDLYGKRDLAADCDIICMMM